MYSITCWRLRYLISFIPLVWLESIPISLCKTTTPREAVTFFELQQVNEDTISNLKTRTGKEISREELTKPSEKSLRDKARREQKKGNQQFKIDEAARQLSRDEAQVVLTVSQRTREGDSHHISKKTCLRSMRPVRLTHLMHRTSIAN